MTASLQAMTLAIFVITAIVAAWSFRRWHGWRGVFLPAFLVNVAGVMFYAAVFTGHLAGDALLLWGAAHRFLMAAFVCGAVVALAWVLSGNNDR